MRILLTGAFGNIGISTLMELMKRDHRIRCFDVRTKRNERLARRFGDRIEVFWGDLRDVEGVSEAVRDQDVVVHLAFVIPKLSVTGVGSEDRPDWARSINVGGTENLLAAARSLARPPRFLFSSSIHVYGDTQDRPSLRTAAEQPSPEEHYARHKVTCENMLRESGLQWSILRFAAALPYSVEMDPVMFDLPLNNRIEYVHTRDVGVAVANAVENEGVWGKILLIGGGPKCRLYYGDLVRIILDAMGVGMLPETAFGRKPFATDWMDTRESQQLLHYQQRDLTDFAGELRKKLGLRRVAVRLLRPLVRRWLLSRSPYYRPVTAQERRWRGKIALITNASHPIGAAAARLFLRAGLRVLLADSDGAALAALESRLADLEARPVLLVLDPGEEEERDRLLREITAAYGGLDVLVHVATLPLEGQGASWKHEEEVVRRHLLPLISLSHLLDGKTAGATRLESRRSTGGSDRRSRHLIAVEEITGLPRGRMLALTRALRAFIRSFNGSLLRRRRRAHFLATDVKVASPAMQRSLASVKAVEAVDVALRIWRLLGRPKRAVYLPSWFIFFYWAEQTLHKALGSLIESLRSRYLKPTS